MYKYENILVTIDTREKDSIDAQKSNNTRMKIVRDLFESLGAMVERKKLDYCDYSITGPFYYKKEEYEINLGIEYKTLNGDFFPSVQKLQNDLFEAHKIFSRVSLIVEENGHELLMTDNNTDGFFQNYGMQSGSELPGTGLYSAYKNFMQSMSDSSIIARSIRSSGHLPLEMVSIMKYLRKPYHAGLFLKEKSYEAQLKNTLIKMPGVGPTNANLIAKSIPNMKYLCDMSQDDIQELLNHKLYAKQLYNFLHSSEMRS